MKKQVLIFGALLAVALASCTGEVTQEEEQTDAEEQVVETESVVTGVAVDGAMNSVALKVGEDTLYYTYPDLDYDHRQSWEMGDTVTVKYYVTQNGDSVVDVINENAS